MPREDQIDKTVGERLDPTKRTATQLQNAEPSNDAYTSAGIDQAQAYANDPANATNNTLRAGEEAPSDNWRSGASGAWQNHVSPRADKAANRWSKVKKNGPLGIVIGGLGTGGIMMSVLFSPGLLLVHLKESLVHKFDSQSTSLSVRSDKILISQIAGTAKQATKGSCGIVTIRCKFTRMSDRLIKNLDKAGLQPIDADGNPLTEKDSLLGKRPAALKYTDGTLGDDGKPKLIKASELMKALRNDPVLRAKFHGAFNPRYAGFADSVFDNILKKFHTTKADRLKDTKSEDIPKEVADDANGKNDKKLAVSGDHQNDQTDDPAKNDEAKAANGETDKVVADSNNLAQGGGR